MLSMVILTAVISVRAMLVSSTCIITYQYIHCESNNLTEFPTIPRIASRDTVTQIKLNGNKLEMLIKKDLEGLQGLIDLYLSHNMLKEIESGAFHALDSLKYCDLSYNVIRTIPADLFKNTKKLKELKLGFNYIEAVPEGSLKGLYFLYILHLQGNLIKTIPWTEFDDLKSLNEIYLHQNPLICDCSIRYLSDWMKYVQSPRQIGLVAVCSGTGTTLDSIPNSFFDKCRDLRNGYECDIAKTCIQSSMCKGGVCACVPGLYDDNGDEYGGMCKEEQSIKDLAGYIGGALLCIVIIASLAGLFILSVIQRKKKNVNKRKKKEIFTHKVFTLTEVTDHKLCESHEQNHYAGCTREVRIMDFVERIKEFHKDSDFLFAQEWENILDNTQRISFLDATSKLNKNKNRDFGYITYDCNRVHLKKPFSDTDYINASFIQGRRSDMDYIATQSPMADTVADFWQMVWEQDVEVIVNVNSAIEDGIDMINYCSERQGGTELIGIFTIQTLATVILENTAVRQLKVTRKKETRTIKQYQLLEWTSYMLDHCSTLLDFVQLVWSNTATMKYTAPKLVHCSYGSGRTGVFIAVDCLLQGLTCKNPDQSIDIYNLVLRMRNQRIKLIENEDEYVFVHECLRHYLEKKMAEEFRRCYELKEQCHVYVDF